MSAAVLPQPALPFIHPDDMPDHYALTGVGTCMEPLLADGACCVFDKRENPQLGDIVGLIFTPEAARRYRMPGWLKRLAMSPPPEGFDGLIVVEQINPPRTYTVPTTDVLAIHKFIGTATPNGDGQAMFRRTAGEA